MNPALGPIKGNQQAVSVYDRDLGNRRTVLTTPEEADEFVKERQEKIKNAQRRGLVDGLLITAGGAGIGGAINAYLEKSNADKLNKIVDQLNPEYAQAYAEKAAQMKAINSKLDPKMSVKMEVLDRDAFKNLRFELGKLFSEDENIFKKVDPKVLMKKGAKYGAIMGAALAAIIGIFTPAFRAENADRKITKDFIENNKFENINSDEA